MHTSAPGRLRAAQARSSSSVSTPRSRPRHAIWWHSDATSATVFLRISSKQIEEEFRKLMSTYGKPIEPGRLFDCLTKPPRAPKANHEADGGHYTYSEHPIEGMDTTICRTPTLIPPRILPLLHDRAQQLVQGSSVMTLLSFGDAVATSEGSPERLFVLLDMYEVMHELQSEVEVIFEGRFSSEMREAAIARCEIKVIDLGSSCFLTDNLFLYVQSWSYQAPGVILGLPYDQRIDIWSIGCILAELYTDDVLFYTELVPIMLAQMIGTIGPIDMEMLKLGEEMRKHLCVTLVTDQPAERNRMTRESNVWRSCFDKAFMVTIHQTPINRIATGVQPFVVSNLLDGDDFNWESITEPFSTMSIQEEEELAAIADVDVLPSMAVATDEIEDTQMFEPPPDQDTFVYVDVAAN
ncbi:hypothetical protein ABZP36_029561 [Zizania latifolia]